ncbi:response regulator [Paenibacillus methanolicus]|uniref:Response regulator receiver domain-containing protein n=1 Tax=Paenibacillus methanolicus TaxID=582686 RepID=A0A5S5C218_9BACL|nr:response regulator [Paenibacillus methanolicus]TYP72512.1 response regulator receiver domain-containing protein [Paenibacillus methanolicus]
MLYIFIILLIVLAALFIWRRAGSKRAGRPAERQDGLTSLNNRDSSEFGPSFSSRSVASEAGHVDASSNSAAPVIEEDGPPTVMIVDDQTAIRMLLREVFELEGLRVFEFSHGKSAIETLQQKRVDYILLDLKMPDMDGIEVLTAIRAYNRTVDVAMITAYGDPLKLDAARKLGVTTFFTKPFEIDDVKQSVLARLNG